MIKNCIICNKEFRTSPCFIKKGQGKYCSQKCNGIFKQGKPTWNKGMKGYTNSGSFKKGQIPWSKGKKYSLKHSGQFKKGQHPSPTTEFKKGRTSLTKGKKLPQFSGNKHWHWQGGKTKTVNGYMWIYQPNHPCANHGYVYEHRLVIEKIIGRYLTPGESTHHLGEKDDNQPQMLMAFTTDSAHHRFHKDPDNIKSEEIIFDGRKL